MITEDVVFRLNFQGQKELETLVAWQKTLREIDGFSPVVIGPPIAAPDPLNPGKETTVDSIGIVTVHDGPSLGRGKSSRHRLAPIDRIRITTTISRIPRRS